MFKPRFRAWVVSVLVAATASAGCESMRNPHDHGGAMVDEVRPEWKPKVEKAPFAAEYVLFAWHPFAPAATRPTTMATATTRPAHQFRARLPWEAATEIDRAFVDRGRPIGFERRGGRLVAVAGQKVFPLPPGHYCWHLLPGNPTAAGRARAGDRVAGFLIGAATAVVVVVVVGGLGWLVYQDNHRHHHRGDGLGDLFGDGVGDVINGD